MSEQETTQEVLIPDTPQNSESQASIVPPEALETPTEGVIAESNKEAPPKDSGIRVESGNEPKSLENQGVANTPPETVNSPLETAQSEVAPESVKAQTSTFEALAENVKVKAEPLNSTPVQTEAFPQTETKSPSVAVPPPQRNLHELRTKELLALKNKTRKRIESIMNLFSKKAKIRNDDVEKYLHVSDATASRYLKTLEQEGKIKKEEKKGKLGKWVSYFKI